MALVSILTFYLSSTVFFFGQLARINIGNFSFPTLDILIIILAFINLIKHGLRIKNYQLLYFVCFAWLSYFINLAFHHYPVLPSLLYLVRLTSLLSFFIVNTSISQKYRRFLSLLVFTNIIFGLIQYFFWPDFTAFGALNWDPHLYRLVSTFFDPTFTGLIYLMFLIKIFTDDKRANLQKIPLLTITYIAIAFTYSRSTFLALVIAAIYYSIKTKKYLVSLLTIIVVVLTILILPRNPGEGTKLERTSSIKAKIENYQEGVSVFLKSPVIGRGYNNLASVRNIKIPNSHSNNGFDGSILTIFCTTGIIGGLLFLFGFKSHFQSQDLVHKTLLVSIFAHSLFANSLLYPWVLFLCVFI